VVGEMQLRHRVELHTVRELRAQESSGASERPHRLFGVLATLEIGHEDLRMREIGRNLDRGDRDAADARVLHLLAQQLRELALDLLADALRALRMLLHRTATTKRS